MHAKDTTTTTTTTFNKVFSFLLVERGIISRALSIVKYCIHKTQAGKRARENHETPERRTVPMTMTMSMEELLGIP